LPANTLLEVSVGDRIESYIVRIPERLKFVHYGRFILFDATVMVFMQLLANFIIIVLSEIVFICFKHNLEV